MRGTEEKLSRWTTQLLLCIAALLITNSHLEKFYPNPLFAGDGLIGNAIFFMVAGIGITLSATTQWRSFPAYYWRRIKRIYPTVIVVVTLFAVLIEQAWRHWNWIDWLRAYLYPTPWAFIAYIMVFYIPFYLLLLKPSRWAFAALLCLSAIAFVCCWIKYPQPSVRLQLGFLHESIYFAFWFMMMLLGGWIAITMRAPTGLITSVGSIVVISITYIILKVLFVSGRIGQGHWLLFPLTFLFVYSLVRLVLSTTVQQFPERFPIIAKFVQFISRRTLEIYTIQPFLTERWWLAKAIPFPANIVIFWLLLLTLAFLVEYAASGLRGGRQAIA